MKKTFLFFLIANTFITSAQIQKNNQSALTIEKIMQDPKTWIGTSPDNIVWGEQSDRIFFSWNPEKDTLSSLYSYNLKVKETAKVQVEEKVKLPASSGNYNAGKTKKVFVRNGNLFIYDIQKGTEKQLTNWLERASSPKFVLNDTEISFLKGNNLFTIHPETGLIKQITNFVEGEERPDPKKTAQDEWLEKQ
ncbi:MAG: S9 family peptidase, partial [Bacteroidetes bacterium]